MDISPIELGYKLGYILKVKETSKPNLFILNILKIQFILVNPSLLLGIVLDHDVLNVKDKLLNLVDCFEMKNLFPCRVKYYPFFFTNQLNHVLGDLLSLNTFWGHF